MTYDWNPSIWINRIKIRNSNKVEQEERYTNMKLKSTNRQYISYGKSKFDPEKINTSEFSSTLLNKPDGCFWASPVDAKYGWAAWATFNLPEYEDGVDKMDYIKFD